MNLRLALCKFGVNGETQAVIIANKLVAWLAKRHLRPLYKNSFRWLLCRSKNGLLGKGVQPITSYKVSILHSLLQTHPYLFCAKVSIYSGRLASEKSDRLDRRWHN